VQLDKNEIPYVVIGGQAVLLYGEPRQTNDIDITLGLDVDQTAHVLEVVKSLELNVLVEESIEQSNKKKLDGIEVNFASKENLIVHKIVADRPRDREDVKGILRRNPDTDHEHITHWLSLFDESLDTNYIQKYKKLIDN
jgi:predicted nucleotidyltransferase